jgi:hypothetical protein
MVLQLYSYDLHLVLQRCPKPWGENDAKVSGWMVEEGFRQKRRLL